MSIIGNVIYMTLINILYIHKTIILKIIKGIIV